MSKAFQEAVEYLYNQTPQFQSIGAAAYKPGLQTVCLLAESFNNPHLSYPVIHVAGTNGKGSTSHTLAAVLQAAGYRVGLYTSPHLVDFRERMRVNGQMIPEERVASFVDDYRASDLSESLAPSFFELTTIMAFDWFRRMKVDVAVVEVGLGGRLDSTNIVDSQLSVITNISYDHMVQLGNTLEMIAAEKAGIMRAGVPVVIGEHDARIREFLGKCARKSGTMPIFAAEEFPELNIKTSENGYLEIDNTPYGNLEFELTGDCQRENALTILSSIRELQRLGWKIREEDVKTGFKHVCDVTGLMGRWMTVAHSPLTICDTGHNIGGWRWLAPQIDRLPRPLTIVLGFVNDKDTSHIFSMLPDDAEIIYTNANIPRALSAFELGERGAKAGRRGRVVAGVWNAYRDALVGHPASIFIGGSTFVVADFLKEFGIEKSSSVRGAEQK